MICDVARKGIESVALAAAARSTIRSFAYELSHPGNAIRHANAVLASPQAGSGVFVTALLIVIEPHTGRFSYARAGHS